MRASRVLVLLVGISIGAGPATQAQSLATPESRSAETLERAILQPATNGTYSARLQGSVAKGAVANAIEGTFENIGGASGGTGLSGAPSAMVMGADGILYAGGSFQFADGIAVNNVAAWNGTAWNALDSGLVGPVVSLAVSGDEALVAAGYFTASNGSFERYVARWDGAEWTDIGPAGSGITHLATGPDGRVFAGGTFLNGDGTSTIQIARLDSGLWSPITSADSPFWKLTAITVSSSGVIFAAGVIHSNLSVIARWHDTGWDLLLSQRYTKNARALIVGTDGSLYAAMDEQVPWGPSYGFLLRYDTTGWVQVGGESGHFTGAPAKALSVDSDGGILVGLAGLGIKKWTGGAWVQFEPGIGGGVEAIVVDSHGSIYAGGPFTSAGGTPANYVAKWNGLSWTPLGAYGFNADVLTMLAVSGDHSDVIVGGLFSTVGDQERQWITSWNGSDWDTVGAGTNGRVYATAEGPDGSVYVAGSFDRAGENPVRGVARWDGSAWHPLGTGRAGTNAMTVGPDGSVYVAYTRQVDRYNYLPFVDRWNGESWTEAVGWLPGSINKLAAGPGGVLYAGGTFFGASGVGEPFHVARWSGSAWEPLGSGLIGSGLNLSVGALLMGPDGVLYAGGATSTGGDSSGPRVAKWDGTDWTTVLDGFVGTSGGFVRALALGPDGKLYVGGRFTVVGGVLANNVAVWDGSEWASLGSGVSGGVNAIALHNDAVILGGSFLTAGGISSPYITRFRSAIVGINPIPEATLSLSIAPNPARGHFRVRFSGPELVSRVMVYDAIGRTVTEIPFADGRGNDIDIPVATASWVPGVYVVRAESASLVQTARVVVIR